MKRTEGTLIKENAHRLTWFHEVFQSSVGVEFLVGQKHQHVWLCDLQPHSHLDITVLSIGSWELNHSKLFTEMSFFQEVPLFPLIWCKQNKTHYKQFRVILTSDLPYDSKLYIHSSRKVLWTGLFHKSRSRPRSLLRFLLFSPRMLTRRLLRQTYMTCPAAISD